MSESYNLRAQVAKTLAPLFQHQGSLSSVLPSALLSVSERDRPLLQQLCYGTLRFWYRSDALASQLLVKPLHPNEQLVKLLLNSAIYQLEQLNMPAHAVIHETVEASKQLGKPWAAKLLNAVLRRYQREQQAIDQASAELDSYRWNHPQWMVEKLRHNWPEHWQQILEANDLAPPMCLRINRLKTDRSQYLKLLDDAGIDGSPGQFSEEAIYLSSAVPVDRLPMFAEGWVSVQDEAAQLAASLLSPAAGTRVLDACAAPGGKLCHLLERFPDINAEALELEPLRAKRIDENLQRLNLHAKVKIGDASCNDWWNGESYDHILLDAPCSASGVIRRNPDIKILRRNEDILTLASNQLTILSNLWDMLKPGGTLLYATCSIFSQENERIVARFLKQQPDALIETIEAQWGEQCEQGRQLFPQPKGPDGFYYARIRRLQEA